MYEKYCRKAILLANDMNRYNSKYSSKSVKLCKNKISKINTQIPKNCFKNLTVKCQMQKPVIMFLLLAKPKKHLCYVDGSRDGRWV